MNVVAMSLHNNSTDLDFKPDENCMSSFDQSRRGKAPLNFTLTATRTPNLRVSLTP